MTDDEILQIITQSNGSICGRLRKDQANRVLIQSEERKIKQFKSNWLVGALLMLGMGKPLAANPVPGKQVTVVVPSQLPSDQSPPNEEEMSTDTLRNFFRGMVVDEKTKEPLPSAVVRLDSSNIGAVADLDGKFTVRIPAHLVADTLVFKISYVSYETKTVLLSKAQLISDREEVYPVYEIQALPTQPWIYTDPLPMHDVGMIIIKKEVIMRNEDSSSPQQWWRFGMDDL